MVLLHDDFLNATIKDCGKQLRKERKRKGLSQADLAARVSEITGRGMSQAYISRVERGRENPTISAFAEFAAALGCVYRSSFLDADVEQSKHK